MNTFKNKFDRFKTMLSAAHQSKAENTEQGSPQWRDAVMRSIRKIGPHAAHMDRPVGFLQLSWRLAPIALLLMIILSIYIIQTGSTINNQMATMTVSEPTSAYLAYFAF